VTADEHLSFDELTELAEGLLARRKESTARAHLASCDECSARADALERTTTALGDLGPLTMPADVVARLDRALASAAQEAPGDTVVPDLGAVRRRRLAAIPMPYAAAASVVVVAIVGVGIATLGHRHHGSAASDTAASAIATPLVSTSAPHQLIQEESGQTYTPKSLTALVPTLVSPALAAAGSQAAPELPAPSTRTESHGAAGTATAPKQLNAVVPPSTFGATNAVPPSLRRYAESTTALSACAAYITDTPGAAPLAVDFARWSDPATHVHKAPSLILVFADPDDSTILDVYVVAPACDASSLRDFTAIPRDGSP
jgi:hypothetical protein